MTNRAKPTVPLQIGVLEFNSKASALKHFREILYKYGIGSEIPKQELIFLLERHPEAAQKIGCGVKHFSVMASAYGTRCFSVVRSDGSTTDFSFKSCISGQAPSRMAEALKAMREEVMPGILTYKRGYFSEGLPRVCPVSRELLTYQTSHVDHVAPVTFHALATGFLSEHGIVPDSNFVVDPADNQVRTTMRDRALAAEWVAYHDALATLRVISAMENLKLSRQ